MTLTLELQHVNCFVFCVSSFVNLLSLVSIRSCLVLFQSFAYVQVIILNKYFNLFYFVYFIYVKIVISQ